MIKMRQYKINSIIPQRSDKSSRFHLKITTIIMKMGRKSRMKKTDNDKDILKNMLKEKDLKIISNSY